MKKYHHISPSVIESLCPGVNHVMISVLQGYLAIRRGDIQQLAKAVQKGQGQHQLEYAHRMKSQFRMLGAEDAAKLCQQLEQLSGTTSALPKTLLHKIVLHEQNVATEVVDMLADLTGNNSPTPPDRVNI